MLTLVRLLKVQKCFLLPVQNTCTHACSNTKNKHQFLFLFSFLKNTLAITNASTPLESIGHTLKQQRATLS